MTAGARAEQACASCHHFDPGAAALASGARYCRRFNVWQYPSGGSDCPRHQPSTGDNHGTKTTR